MKHTHTNPVTSLANIFLSQLLFRRQADKMWEDSAHFVRKKKNVFTLRDYSLNFSTKGILFILLNYQPVSENRRMNSSALIVIEYQTCLVRFSLRISREERTFKGNS